MIVTKEIVQFVFECDKCHKKTGYVSTSETPPGWYKVEWRLGSFAHYCSMRCVSDVINQYNSSLTLATFQINYE